MRKQISVEEMKWIKDLQLWLFDNITPYISNKQEIQVKFITSEAMSFFAKAFTHESVEATDNYEELEFFGDNVLKTTVSMYLMSKFPQLDRTGLSNMVSRYSDNFIQKSIFLKLGINDTKLIRVGSGLSTLSYNIIGDVFESMFGALFIVAEHAITGSGYTVCYNLTKGLYDLIDVNIKDAETGSKTIVTQLFGKFQFMGKQLYNPIDDTSDTEPDMGIVKVWLTKKHLDFLYKVGGIDGLPTVKTMIGYGKHPEKSEASRIAYENAYKWLTDRGITLEWSNKLKFKLDVNREPISNWWPKARAKLIKEGYTDADFTKSNKMSTKNRRVMLFVGYKDGKWHTLSSIDTNQYQVNIGKAKMLEMYATGSKLRYTKL